MHKPITLPLLLLALLLPFTSMAAETAEAEEITLDASYFAGSWKLIAAGPKLFAKKPDRVDDNPFSYIEKKKIKTATITTVSARGTYMSGSPFGQKTPMPNYAMRGAIIECEGGPIFIKMTGPTDDVTKSIPGFDKTIKSGL